MARSAAAATGAAVGAVVAVAVSGPLFSLLFDHVGKPVANSVVSRATEGRSGVEAVVVGIFIVIAAVVLAILVVAALVAPVFLLLPLAATAIALRLTGAGLILRSLGLMVGVTAGLGLVLLGVSRLQFGKEISQQLEDLEVLYIGASGWVWIVLVAGAAFVGRMAVELWRPDQAGVPDRAVLTALRRGGRTAPRRG